MNTNLALKSEESFAFANGQRCLAPIVLGNPGRAKSDNPWEQNPTNAFSDFSSFKPKGRRNNFNEYQLDLPNLQPPQQRERLSPGSVLSFSVLRRWEGTVLSKNANTFFARVVDPDKKRNDEEAEFSMSDVTEFDRDLVEEGAVFYWTVGYAISATGNRMRGSQLRFRRLPVWDAEELKRAKQKALQLRDLFESSDGQHASERQ